ncbi:NUDIX domain-containing protein [Haladaptatus caseinilyticus]|uniref:NUDIX domain-containing protein n=1 Tax=Haladaptatus caseinilyticus TaxID=2993314 RepID=UPI00224B1FCE|nr:NUDIX hydrolase [Haladaptatus caseinilyticus]
MNGISAIRHRNDVREGTRTFSLPADNFATVKSTIESGRDQWAGVVVTNEDGRILLVENGWSDGWVVPGGTVEVDETLAGAAVREVAEETGVSIELDGPLLVERQTFTHDGKAVSGHFVLFGGTADEAEIGSDLGVEGETICDARWFTTLPELTIDYRAEIEAFRG